MFKLLALRVLDGCADHIKKCLNKNEYYYFCMDYRFDEPNRIYRGSRYVDPLHDTFFTPIPDKHYGNPKESKLRININAIVGKNGDGKSTIVELMMRLLNNYIAKKQEDGEYKSNQKLIPIKDVRAELYFLQGKTIYKFIEDEDSHGVYALANIDELENSEKQYVAIPIEPEEAPDVLKNVYTFVSNYSHYAYNIYDFRLEWYSRNRIITEQDQNDACWLYRIFHKNDGYIIPIALHPYRESGKIDINKEASLAKQRLLDLYAQPDDSTKAFRKLLGKEAVGIRLFKHARLKYLEHTIKDFFDANKSEDTTLDWALDAIRKQLNTINESADIADKVHESFASISYLCDMVFKEVDKAFEQVFEGSNFKEEDRIVYKAFLTYITTTLAKKYRTTQSSISEYVSAVLSLNTSIKSESFVDIINSAPRSILPNEDQLRQYAEMYGEYNFSQIARLHTIFSVALRSGVEIELLTTPYKKLTNKDKAQLYKIYKTLSIFEKYPSYQQHIQPKAKKSGADYCFEYTEEELDNLFEQLNKDKNNESHITRKLVITENYLAQIGDIYYRQPDIINILHKTPKDTKHSLTLPLSCIYDYYGKVDVFHSIPPIFEYSIIYKEGEDLIEMETLSSGERQLLNTIGAIIYHLRNINSTTAATYDTVNLLLEEIELYYHPEYQRMFVNLLLEQIYGLNLKRIQNINITFVTHSPFVLSDIPKCNVLFLQDGKPNYGMQENTFGANIHSLFKNGFFLPNMPIGQFAHKKINELFRQLNSDDYDHRPENIKRIKQEIALVGEPYLREQLYRLLPK